MVVFLFTGVVYDKNMNNRGNVNFDEGFTLVELLLVVLILGILILLAVANRGSQVAKGLDARKKADLHQLSVVFEDYYNDHGCYPPEEYFDEESDCGSDQMMPYINEIPCDPDGSPYDYHLSDDECSDYWVYADLEWESDPAIEEVGCESGCGTDGLYDWGLASGGNSLKAEEYTSKGNWACKFDGNCNVMDPVPDPSNCPSYVTYQECQNACDADPSIRCPAGI